VESTVPEGGVYSLQEDSRIIGLIYTAKMNKNKIFLKKINFFNYRRDMQLNQLTKLEAQFSTSQEQLRCVQERIKALEIAMQKAREVRRFPFLEQYCTLDEVLKTLQTPVDNQSFNMKCTAFGSGLRFVTLSLVCFHWHIIVPYLFPLIFPLNFSLLSHSLCSSVLVTMWVVVTNIMNPSHFYVRYVAEKRENEALSRKINKFCRKDRSHFTLIDTLETGSLIFVKWNQDFWCRANVVEIMQKGCMEAVKVCPVNQLASIQVFFLDYGFTKRTTESSLKALNNHLRKMNESVRVVLHHFSPQAIRCSLKDLVPYDLTKGWSKMAQVEFQNVVGSAAVEMRPLGQDSDSLLVDLKKSPMDQSIDVPISVREYLVFIEVARFYSPLTVDRKPLLYYRPVYPKLNREVNAVVSHINNPADFYIQQVKNMESLLLSAKLQDSYNTLTVAEDDNLQVYCPVIGQAYVALYDDKLWYRAQVIGHPGGRRVEVQYVDFGNKSIVSVTNLRKIKDEFFALPTMAIHCSLSDVIPLNGKIWNEACTNRFISLAHQKLVTIVATAGTTSMNEPLPVRLFESGLNGASFFLSFGRFRSKNAIPPDEESVIWDPPLELDSAMDDVTKQKVTEEQTEDLLEFNPQLKLPAQPKDLKVRVSHVNSPSSFYVQLTQYNTHLTRIYELLKQECTLLEPEDVTWKADMYCAAHINGVWERGQICADVSSSNTAEVKRCDHGNTVKLDVSKLRPLPSSLMGSFALECTLTDIRPAGGRSTWTATACDLISYYLTGASAIMTIKELTDERPVPVTLFCSNKTGQFVSIADFLVSEGLALRERKPRSVCFFFFSVCQVMTQLYLPPELPCPCHIQMSVSAIGEDGLIYMRTQDAECQLEQLRERIRQSMKTLPTPKPYTWKSVQGCAVIGPDMLWYRGQLLEVLGEYVKVQYIDYGLVENIPVVHVYPILLCEDVPQLCMPCQLHGINPIGGTWQWDSVALLREIFLNRSVDIQVMELPADPRDPITVELFLDGLSLKRILCHHEHASIDRTDSGQEVCVCIIVWLYWCLFAQIFLHTQNICVYLQGHSSMSPAILDEWDTDAEVFPCLAQYSDGKYYRAKLIRFISVEPVMILVHHPDFGSDDTLPTSKIREMPVELLRFPVRALKVRVAGFKAPSVSSQEVVLPYSPKWSVKAAMEMIDLLHTSITVSVVACEPELTVLLYDKSGELLHLPLVSQGLAELD
uniref:Tudor domain-containing protein n=1 Tax=Mola mola TaxID=94237 RepID=A0A3Q3XBP1_MOLML